MEDTKDVLQRVMPEILKPARNPRDRKRRDHEAEKVDAQASLFDAVVEYGITRKESVTPQLTQIANALILCGLPYRQTELTEITRVSRASNGSQIRVTFYSLRRDAEGKRIPMAFGADRTFLHWAVDKAVKRGNPFVPLAYASEFMRDTGQTQTGPNYARLREAFRRLSSLAIVVERRGKGIEEGSIVPLMGRSRLPTSINPDWIDYDPAAPEGIRFSGDFFNEIMAHHVPFPWQLLRDLSMKPQMQDIVLFLNWRSFAAKSESTIPWAMLRDQLWHDDSNPRRIRTRFNDAIALLKAAWPELNAEATDRGLRIAPPFRGRHLVPSQA